MPSCNLITDQCFTGKQFARSSQEEQAGYWVENLLFKGDQPFGLHPSHLLGRGSQNSKTTIEEIESSYARSASCRSSLVTTSRHHLPHI